MVSLDEITAKQEECGYEPVIYSFFTVSMLFGQMEYMSDRRETLMTVLRQERCSPIKPPLFLLSQTTKKKLQNYSPRLGTVIFEAFSLRKRNSMKYTTRQQFQKKKNCNYLYGNIFLDAKLFTAHRPPLRLPVFGCFALFEVFKFIFICRDF